MFTKQDREKYFQKVLAHERLLGHKMQELFRLLKKLDIKEPMDDMLKDEERHNSFAVLLCGILQGVSEEESQAYASIRKFLDSILPQDNREKRHYVREPFLGLIRMCDLETGETRQVKCMDVSPGGVGIECHEAIPVGRSYRLEISLYKYSTSMEQTAKLIWLKEIIPGTFIGGMQFSSGQTLSQDP